MLIIIFSQNFNLNFILNVCFRGGDKGLDESADGEGEDQFAKFDDFYKREHGDDDEEDSDEDKIFNAMRAQK